MGQEKEGLPDISQILRSPRYFAFLFEQSFSEAVQQFKEIDYSPEGTFIEFLDHYKVLDSIPRRSYIWTEAKICLLLFVIVVGPN